MTRKIIEYGFDELKKVSHEIGKMLLKSKVLLLYGDLGSGKTTFTKSIVENLGGDPLNVTSPTFNLVHIYDVKKFKIWHFDLYRIKSEKELFNIGIEDAMENGILIIEWGEIAEKLLKKNYLRAHIKFTNDEFNRRLILDY
ncbi:tRNA (adenosine(37)-N6)-threonylcarbamoyltransferase complex ATPase subunit type 1 TsaE [Candidatus Bandiella numerosa]|uniref:tRNA (adenosine(37)-N6)-threonylcarbamoyltransferase complex ATPase subunit type 1 TsaE n=1 Tax=Candidatus Bandiella numerosa TaxID=2570586 RepID=UPI001F012145|nr:tRNA (adenosine(37)-N6)-threonylcarbamoyltransferase complex ATPase subunit type 1 TsaE [Candidatus Bandiella numerosa]